MKQKHKRKNESKEFKAITLHFVAPTAKACSSSWSGIKIGQAKIRLLRKLKSRPVAWLLGV